MNTHIEITVKCKKCGKPAPVDREKSNENWTVQKCNAPCECGGEFGLCVEEVQGRRKKE